MLRLLLLVATTRLCVAVPLHDNITPRQGEHCGYESCTKPKDGYLNVHIVAHTHNDVGWLKTVDQYYYGNKKNIQVAGVQYILESVVNELWNDPKRKFIYVETAFFHQWWVKQTPDMQERVHTLVRQGRLQMTSAAWSMNDEAAAHYHSIIDQFTWGLRLVNATFGECGRPLVGWQIDPFGHSREFASLLAQLGLRGVLLGRIDYQDKKARQDEKRMEMMWRGSDVLGESSDILTSVLYNQYQPPAGFCFDILCSDEPVTDDNYEERASEFIQVVTNISQVYSTNNVLITMGEDFHYQAAASWFVNLDRLILLLKHRRCIENHYGAMVEDFIRVSLQRASVYQSNNVLITMGDDFTYQSASSWFINLDRLIQHTNEIAEQKGIKINVFYSTPACYMKAVEDANITLTTKTDDFFPYGSDPTAYWTGYFTSRPTTKYYERQSNTVLQMFKQLIVLMGAENEAMPVLNEFKSAMGMMQHHDAITGTEKQHVANDYMKILYRANHKADAFITDFFSSILNDNAQLYNDRCQLNISSCQTSMYKEFSLAVYNPVAWSVVELIEIPVPSHGHYEIYDSKGEKIEYSILAITDDIKAIPNRLNQNYVLVLPANLPPMSLTTYYVRKIKTKGKRTTKYNGNNFKTQEHRHLFKNQDDLRNKNDFNNENHNKHIYENIPERIIKNDDVRFNYDLNLDVLKNKFEPNEDIAMLVKIIKEAKEDVVQKRPDEDTKKIVYPFSDEEMRMLGDDPMVIEAPTINILQDENNVGFDPLTPKLTATFKNGNNEINVGIKMAQYEACSGDNYHERASGAYIFRPNGTARILEGKTKVFSSHNVIESRMNYRENVSLRLRTYNIPGISYSEVFWTVGPIDIDDSIGKEHVIRYNANLITNGIFYTDSNGRQMIKRKLDSRDDYNVTLKEPIPGNYYPITNRITIVDDKEFSNGSISVITDRSEGATSLNGGEIEIMLHRRLLHDDGFGVGEALNETENDKGLIVTGRQKLYLSLNNTQDLYVKKLTIQTDLHPRVYFAKGNGLEKWLNDKIVKQISFVNELPIGLHLLTVEPLQPNELLLRLENYLEKTDKVDTDIKVNLNKIFKTLNVNWYRETYLGANRWKGELNNDNFDVTIKAKQIKTFIVGFNRK